MRPRSLSSAALIAAALLAPLAPAHAWNSNPSVGTTISNLPAASLVRDAIPDGAGGVFVAWEEFDVVYGVRVQHLNATGHATWIANGIETSATTGSLGVRVDLVLDGSGGVIVVSSERRSATTGYDIFAQRLSALGARQWGSSGVTVCSATLDQTLPGAVSDGAGGVVIAWQDLRNNATLSSDIYAQRVTAAGAVAWTAQGVPVASLAAAQQSPVVETDGAGGAIVAWEDLRSQASSGRDLYAQRVRGSDGARLWFANGVVVSSAANDQSRPALISDGTGGVLVVWTDQRTPGNSSDIYADQINGAGELTSFLNNVPLCTAPGEQGEVYLAEDGQGGAIVAWHDQRLGLGNPQIYAQHLLAGLVPAWAANGVAMQPAPIAGSAAFMIGVVPDGFGGGIVSWSESGNPVAQRLNGAGTAQWTAGGLRLQTHSGGTFGAVVCPDGRGGVIMPFSQVRGLTLNDVFVMRVDRYGFYGDTEPLITRVRDIPNDQGGRLKVEWNASYLEFDGFGAVTSYNVFRSVPSALLASRRRAGALLTHDAERVSRDPAGTLLAANGYAFELVGTVSALDLSAYSFVLPTLGDSIAGSNPPTVVMVQARGASGRYWSSEPDSGYSVDNLAPAAPAAFAGTFTAGAMRLRWNPNHEADLVGYRLYRGTTPDFTTDAAHLVVATTDTVHVDAAGAPYLYKLAAVDLHGNESPVALVGSGATLDAGSAPAAGPSFAAPSPNPASGATTLAFTLAHGGDVRLELFDTAGRRVRVLHESALPPGTHRRALDLRDDDGRALPPGLYHARLAAEGRVLKRSVVVVR